MTAVAFLGLTPCIAPLCPAGHLPRKGGDWLSPWFRQSATQAIGETKAAVQSPP